MKKIHKTHSREFGPLLVRPSTIRAIFDCLRDVQSVSIICDDYEFESIDEFESSAASTDDTDELRPHTVRIIAEHYSLVVDLDATSARVSLDKDDHAWVGRYARICEILKACERKPLWLYRGHGSTTVGLLTGGFVGSNIIPPSKASRADLYLLACLVALFVFFLLWEFRQKSGRRVVFRGAPKNDPPSLLSRFSSNAMAAAIMGALIGAIVAAAAIKFFDHVLPTGNQIAAPPRAEASKPEPAKP